MNRAALLVIAGLGLAALAAGGARALSDYAPQDIEGEGGEVPLAPQPGALDALGDWTENLYAEVANMPQAPAHSNDQNRRAFLATIAACEGTDAAGGYACLFGSTPAAPKTFEGFADHPRIRTYEAFDGQFLKNGKIDYTTAAGRYQITETTWNTLAARLGLRDFSPPSQDAAALELIREAGALGDIDAGRVLDAARKVRRIWASLPGNESGQAQRSQGFVMAAYQSAGGATA